MARGLYRIDDNWVQVCYGSRHWYQISRKRYEEMGYQPAFELLPKEQDAAALEEKRRRSGEQR